MHVAAAAAGVRYSWQTVDRRFAEWSAARGAGQAVSILLDELGAQGGLDWSRCAIDPVSVRGQRGDLTE